MREKNDGAWEFVKQIPCRVDVKNKQFYTPSSFRANSFGGKTAPRVAGFS